MTPAPPPDADGCRSCLGCLGFGLAYLVTLTAMGAAAWRGSVLGIAAAAVFLAVIIAAARSWRGITDRSGA